MPIGPGKYDKECTQVRDRLKADGVIVIVLGGKKGHGFSAQLPTAATLAMPQFLRSIADEIEASIGKEIPDG